MKKLSILLAIPLLLAAFAVCGTYAQAAGPAGGGGSAGYGLLDPGSSGAGHYGSSGPGCLCSSGAGPRKLKPFYPPGTNTGRDNDKPGLDLGSGY